MSRPAGKAPLPPELERGYVMADLTPVRGELRQEPADFEVEELPLYEPGGEGQHLYVRIEKRGLSTDEALRKLAQALGIARKGIGYAGLKDARAVTRQTFSLPGVAESQLSALEPLAGQGLRVLWAKPHTNKLKVGHLAGNRFRLRLRGGGPDLAAAQQGLVLLSARGVPNYYGLQRFGNARNTHRLGEALVREDAERFLELLLGGEPEADWESPAVREARALVREGEYASAAERFPRSFGPERAAALALARGQSPQEAVRAVALKPKVLYVAAFQSLLFNAYLTRRLDLLDRLEVGEVATLARNGASFVVEDAEAETARCRAHELSPSGPCFGRKLLRPRPESSAWRDEEAVLAELAPGISAELGPALGAKPQGQRRPLRIPLREASACAEGDDLVLAFTLPRGCYATSVVEELRRRPTD